MTSLTNSNHSSMGISSPPSIFSMRSTTFETMHNTSQSHHAIPGVAGDNPDLLYDIIYVFTILIFCSGIPPNVVNIYIISTVRRLRSPTNKIVVNLAVTDCMYLLYYLVSLMDQVHKFITFDKNLLKFLYPSIDMFMASASLINVAALSLDRLVGCWYPLQYESMMHKKAPRIICFTWIYSFVIFLIALVRIAFQNKIYQDIVFYTCVVLSFVLPVLTVLISYGSILACAHRSIKRTKNLYKSVNVPTDNHLSMETVSESESSLNLQRKRTQSFMREFKVTLIILIIVLPFTLGWCFYVGVQVYEDLKGTHIRNLTFNVFFHITPSVVSAFNAYIYFMLNKSFRTALRRKLRKTFFGRYSKYYCCFDLQRSGNSRNLQSSSIQMHVMSSTASYSPAGGI